MAKHYSVTSPYNKISHLNVTAAKVMDHIVALARDNEEHKGWIKIDNTNSAYIPVSVEILQEEIAADGTKFVHISVAHYSEVNGDLMADPVMEFLAVYTTWEPNPYYFPMYYRNDFAYGYERTSMSTDINLVPQRCSPSLSREQAEFANMWMRNINEQQKLQVA